MRAPTRFRAKLVCRPTPGCGAEKDEYETMDAHGWSDALRLVPPTGERV